ncbi:MAG: hypothetical protein V3R33_07310 [Anaerolineales bacterium]
MGTTILKHLQPRGEIPPQGVALGSTVFRGERQAGSGLISAGQTCRARQITAG